jgi:hypothetical protein
MILTLKLRNPEAVPGAQPEFKLARRDALIGRSKSCDWSLPDEKSFISSKHAQISFRDDGYYLKDISTNGTLLNGGSRADGGRAQDRAGRRLPDRRISDRRRVAAGRGQRPRTAAPASPRRCPAGFRRQHEHWSRGADGTSRRPKRPPVPPAAAAADRGRVPPPAKGDRLGRGGRAVRSLHPVFSANDLRLWRAGLWRSRSGRAPAVSDGSGRCVHERGRSSTAPTAACRRPT